MASSTRYSALRLRVGLLLRRTAGTWRRLPIGCANRMAFTVDLRARRLYLSLLDRFRLVKEHDAGSPCAELLSLIWRSTAIMTLVFYNGYGFVPIALLFLSGLVATIFGLDTHDQSVLGIPIITAGFLTGVACAVLKIRDSRAGRDFRLMSTQHTFMFLPVVFWCPLLIVIGVCKMP